MKTKSRMRLEIKEITTEGTFEGLLSPYGNIDGGGDVVLPGAYAKTLKEQGNARPLLWQHRPDTPIGLLTLEDRADGLWCKGELLMALDQAKTAYLLMKKGIIDGLSIGFESVKDSVQNGVRQLKEIKLYEGSIVTFPMNEMARVASVKAAGESGDFTEEFSEIQLQCAGQQMMQALNNVLCEIRWSDMSKDDQVTASQDVISQFSEAYLAYLPAYADMMAEMYGGMESMGKRDLELKAAIDVSNPGTSEQKEGRMISGANKDTIKSACDYMMKAHEIISALVEDEAGAKATTPESQAAAKPEPDQFHSAAQILADVRSLIQAA